MLRAADTGHVATGALAGQVLQISALDAVVEVRRDRDRRTRPTASRSARVRP
jgi:hypothetical protein